MVEPRIPFVDNIWRATEYLSQDEELWIYPRFEKLHVFNIMALKNQLSEQEKKLDCEYFEEPPIETAKWLSEGTALVCSIRETIKAYGDSHYQNRISDATLLTYF
jgi:hypothetical protein